MECDPTKPQVCASCGNLLKPNRRAYLLESRVYQGPVPEITPYGLNTYMDADDVLVACSKGCARKALTLLI